GDLQLPAGVRAALLRGGAGAPVGGGERAAGPVRAPLHPDPGPPPGVRGEHRQGRDAGGRPARRPGPAAAERPAPRGGRRAVRADRAAVSGAERGEGGLAVTGTAAPGPGPAPTGRMFIGAERTAGSGPQLRSTAPATGEPLEPGCPAAGAAEADRACALAEEAFDAYRATPAEQRAAFLEAVADGLEA